MPTGSTCSNPGIAAVVSDYNPDSGSLLLKEDLVANSARPISVPNVEVTQVGIVLDEIEGRCRWPSNEPQLVQQRGLD